jgi:hypothetical protein
VAALAGHKNGGAREVIFVANATSVMSTIPALEIA